jgi:hypothetical protein
MWHCIVLLSIGLLSFLHPLFCVTPRVLQEALAQSLDTVQYEDTSNSARQVEAGAGLPIFQEERLCSYAFHPPSS